MHFHIDGQTYFTRSIDPATMEEFLREFFMILNVAMGGTLGSDNQPPKTQWPQGESLAEDDLWADVTPGHEDDDAGRVRSPDNRSRPWQRRWPDHHQRA